MVHLRRTVAKLRNLLANTHAEEDLAREVASHLTLLADDFERRGMSAEEARLAALRAFGGVEQAKQAHRDERSLLWIEQAMQDLRYGLRTLSRSPGFTITAVLTLAVGIGACTAIFSLVNAVLIRSLPYGDSSRLVYLYTPNPQFKLPAEVFGPAYADFYDLKRESHSFRDITVFDQSVFSLASSGAAERISAAQVDGDFFRTFQSSPELGREISPDDNQLGHERVAVISHALWQSIFGSAADVLHRSLLLDGRSYEIIGVMPQGFEYPHNTDLTYGEPQYKTTQVWIPLALTPQQMADRENSSGNAVARLKPGVSIAQAQAEMATIMVRLDKLHDPQARGWGALIENFVDSTVRHVRSLLWLLLGAVSHRALDRLQQRRKSAAGPRRRTHSRVGRSCRPRSRPLPYHPPAHHGGSADRPCRRSHRCRLRVSLLAHSSAFRSRQHPTPQRSLARHARTALHHRSLPAYQRTHRRLPGTGRLARQPHRLPRHHR